MLPESSKMTFWTEGCVMVIQWVPMCNDACSSWRLAVWLQPLRTECSVYQLQHCHLLVYRCDKEFSCIYSFAKGDGFHQRLNSIKEMLICTSLLCGKLPAEKITFTRHHIFHLVHSLGRSNNVGGFKLPSSLYFLYYIILKL